MESIFGFHGHFLLHFFLFQNIHIGYGIRKNTVSILRFAQNWTMASLESPPVHPNPRILIKIFGLAILNIRYFWVQCLLA